ncbi:MAG: hypothetical protein LBE79_03455 [Tannerella sp.]|jgi:hypothetical protein|nr:hypothetical protein [Tannerella sp.]
MKFMTKDLVYFAVAAIVLTLVFRFTLSAMLTNEWYISVIIPATLYGCSMFVAGWYFGFKDGRELPIYDVGFRFHFTTYVSFHAVSSAWFLLGLNANTEKWKSLAIGALIWGFFLAVHFIFFMNCKKKAIDGLDKKELFD